MRRGWYIAGIVAAATVVAEAVLRHAAHPVFPWHSLPAFDLAYGAAGCAVLIAVSKALGRAGLQQPAPRGGDEEEEQQ